MCCTACGGDEHRVRLEKAIGDPVAKPVSRGSPLFSLVPVLFTRAWWVRRLAERR